MPVEIDGNATVARWCSTASARLLRYAAASSSRSPCPPPSHTGPTAWITFVAGSRNPSVMRASPVGHRPSSRHAARSSRPAARWIAPSTPPPPDSAALAAFTIASTASVVMSATISSIRPSM